MTHLVVREGGGGGGVRVIPRKGGHFHSLSPYHKDVMCMARASVVGKCYAEKEESDSWTQKWNIIKRSNKSLKTVEAMKLLDQANIPYDKPCGIEEYKLIQAVMAPDYLIKVHSQHPKDRLLFPL